MRWTLLATTFVAALAVPALGADLSVPRQGAAPAPVYEQQASGGFNFLNILSIPFRLAKVGTDAGAGIVTTAVSIPSAALSVFIPAPPAPVVVQTPRGRNSGY